MLIAESMEDADDNDDDDDGKDGKDSGPTNLVAWISNMANMILGKMKADQGWQASMDGREEKYNLLSQFFDAAAEIVQGPNRGNQALLLESEILLDVTRLWKLARIDEFKFRDLIQDNEDLFTTWMALLRSSACVRSLP